MPNNGSYPNFGRFSQTFGVNAKILGFYTLGTHYSWGYPNFESLPKMCYVVDAREQLDLLANASERVETVQFVYLLDFGTGPLGVPIFFEFTQA